MSAFVGSARSILQADMIQACGLAEVVNAVHFAGRPHRTGARSGALQKGMRRGPFDTDRTALKYGTDRTDDQREQCPREITEQGGGGMSACCPPARNGLSRRAQGAEEAI